MNFSHADKASEDNLHKDKRIINWQPFMPSVYGVMHLSNVMTFPMLYTGRHVLHFAGGGEVRALGLLVVAPVSNPTLT